MKIYPGLNNATIVSDIDLNREVPIAYIDTDYIVPEIKLSIGSEYKRSYKNMLLPYSPIDSMQTTLYQENGEPLTIDEQIDISLKDKGGTSYYMPVSSKTFNPLLFSYKVLAKKHIKYISSRKYYIYTACLDNDPEAKLANKLIKYFADANSKSLCPSNIIFNNNDAKLSSLLNSSYDKTDFMFIDSKDITAEELDNAINECIKDYIVPWIIEDNEPEENSAEANFIMKESIAINTDAYKTNSYFKIPQNDSTWQYKSLFTNNDISPIIICEQPNKGFMIKSTRQFIDSLETTYKIFYETLFYVYFNCYIATDELTDWICDNVPDYIVKNNTVIKKNKFTSDIELYKIFGLEPNDAEPITVSIKTLDSSGNKTDDDSVCFVSLSSNYLVFKKISNKDNADPVKEPGQISMYTSRKNIMYYENPVYEIGEDIEDKIKISIFEKQLKVMINPFKNTKLNTRNFTEPVTLLQNVQPNAESQSFYIMYDLSQSRFYLSTSQETDDEIVKLGEIKISNTKTTTKIYDMRVRGGGVKNKNSLDNDILYNCLDISNPLGRPYRKGGALIVHVNIPEEYQDKEQEIYNIVYEALDKNKIAEDYLILKLNFI